jgi:hypothetical protein
VTVADDQLARIGPELDAWDREDASSAPGLDDRLPHCAREGLALLEALRPIIPIAIRLGAGQAPGNDAAEDASWTASVALARRDLLAQQSARTDHGLAGDSLRLLDRIDSMVGEWSDDWEELARRRFDGERHKVCVRRDRKRRPCLQPKKRSCSSEPVLISLAPAASR